MSTFRTVFSICVLAALGMGYAASQYFAFAHDENGASLAQQWARNVDTRPVALAALLVLLAAIVLWLVPERKEDS